MFWVYVGTYTGAGGEDKSQGIYLMELDLRSGTLSSPRVVAAAIDPSFLAIHPSRKFLYAVSERSEVDGRPGGRSSAFSIDPASGTLTPINQQSSVGAGPCHLIVDRAGKNVLVANYGSGSVACLPIDADRPARPELVVHPAQGHGAATPAARGARTPTRSTSTRAGRFAVAADLGLDKVFIYRFDDAKGTLDAE